MSRVVVIEQDEPLIRLMGWFLVEAGFEVSVVSRIRDMLERLDSDPPDLIICNTNLPAIERRGLFGEWKQICPEISIIDISAAAWCATEVDTGADARLSFPFHADTLIETARNLLL